LGSQSSDWNVMLCSLIDGYQHFWGAYYLHFDCLAYSLTLKMETVPPEWQQTSTTASAITSQNMVFFLNHSNAKPPPHNYPLQKSPQLYIAWKPILSSRHKDITYNAIYWQRCCSTKKCKAIRFSCGIFNINVWSQPSQLMAEVSDPGDYEFIEWKARLKKQTTAQYTIHNSHVTLQCYTLFQPFLCQSVYIIYAHKYSTISIVIQKMMKLLLFNPKEH
jgi:hypothetical protein